MKSITVFCGSSSGNKTVFTEQAALLGKRMAEKNIHLVYGGAQVGIMGTIADHVLLNGGTVTGILPEFLQKKELAHQRLTELIIVGTMHERKTLLHEKCDGGIALPGGYGTLEELFEILTWVQLGLQAKPIGILNTDGYYDALKALVQSMVDNGFLKGVDQDRLIFSDNVDDLLRQLENYKAPHVTKWISENEL